jgi:hypothetical protein
VVSYANIFAKGLELDKNSFSGGLKLTYFRLLQQNGVLIIKKGENEKLDFFDQLKKFVDQVETHELKTSQM